MANTTVKIPTSSDIYLEADGVKVAVVQSYRSVATRTERTVEAFGESEPVATIAGHNVYQLTLTRLYATDEAISDPAVRELSGRISLHAEERPDGIFLSTRAEARTGDGNEYSAFVRIPRGNEHMGDALTLEEKKQKFTTNLSFGLSLDSRKAERIWEMFRKLKELDSLTPLAEAMRP